MRWKGLIFSVFLFNRSLKVSLLVNICSLTELCLKVVYGQLEGRVVMSIKVTQEVHLHLPSVSVASSGLMTLSDLRPLLPRNLWTILSCGPVAHCDSPSCCRPLFQETTLQLVERTVQSAWAGGGDPGLTSVLASRLYCHSACYVRHRTRPSQHWEETCHERQVAWRKIKK